MWPFKKKQSLDDRINKAIDCAMIRKGLHDSDLQQEFAKMNEQILGAFGRSNHATDLNSESIISLAQSLAIIVKAVDAIDDRLKALESQLSITKITFAKGGN